MAHIRKDEWVPVDGILLEENALLAVKSNVNALVIAGPGAGKSELLAQRACYLLQTNECIDPYKILAVSFKKDAASNIQDRVQKRCGRELGDRFISMTFDAFAKALIDQFLNAIPYEYRPKKDYEIVTDDELIGILKEYELFSYTKKWQYKNVIDRLTSVKLPFTEANRHIKSLWQIIASVEDEEKCYLTFRMVSRLAEYLIRSNPLLKRALSVTYSYIFLDEYQDTTSIQYDLFKTCFFETPAVVTAVGDDKQRIMVWAGAMKEAFPKFINDFNAIETMLIMNHRSAPRLLQIQKTLYKEFFYKNSEFALDIVNNNKWKASDGEAFLHLFESDDQEANILTSQILNLLGSGYKERDICILVKQTPNIYCQKIIENLSKVDIKARNEARYQDLLKEDLIKLLIAVMEILINDSSSDEWIYLIELYKTVNDYDGKDVYKGVQLEKALHLGINQFRIELGKIKKYEDFISFIKNIIEFINKDKIRSIYIQYRNENTFNKHLEEFCDLFWDEYEFLLNWEKALHNFKGEDSIPIMTIHKSKGLEYDCVFFVGLEDGSFWTFNRQRIEDFCTFFVALSRAKKRLDFTFCKTRSLTNNYKETRNNIKEFYELLANSGVVEVLDYST